MLPRNRGHIIQVGSALAYRGIPLQSAYCAAKHAIQGFNDSLRCELLHDKSNVKLTMVQMPALNTPQFDWVKSRLPRKPQPVPPIFQPEVAAEAIRLGGRPLSPRVVCGRTDGRGNRGQQDRAGPGRLVSVAAGLRRAADMTATLSADRRDNLYQPVDEESDFGAHGDFDRRA